VKASAWRTWGEPARLLLDTEEALGIGFARLLVIDLLRHNHLGIASLLSADSLLSVIAPYFPSSDSDSTRSLLSAGPYANVHAVLDKTMRGWLHARSKAGEGLRIDLLKLAEECRGILEGAVSTRMLLSQGIHELSFPSRSTLRSPIGPSSVSWYQPCRVNLRKTQALSEYDSLRGGSLGLGIWLAPHICSKQALGADEGSGALLASVLQALLETGRVVSEPKVQRPLQAWMRRQQSSSESRPGPYSRSYIWRR